MKDFVAMPEEFLEALLQSCIDRGWDDKSVKFTHCYDFPNLVMHLRNCPRSKGGACFPVEVGEPPMSAEDKRAIVGYLEMLLGHGQFIPVKRPAGAKTFSPDGKVYE